MKGKGGRLIVDGMEVIGGLLDEVFRQSIQIPNLTYIQSYGEAGETCARRDDLVAPGLLDCFLSVWDIERGRNHDVEVVLLCVPLHGKKGWDWISLAIQPGTFTIRPEASLKRIAY